MAKKLYTTDLSKHLDHSFISANFHNELLVLKEGTIRGQHFDEKRAFIRSLAAMVEGIGYQLRQYMLGEHALKHIELSIGEQVVLSETKHVLDEKGKLRESRHFYPTLPMFEFTVHRYAHHFNRTAEVQPMFSESGWEKFKLVFKKRDQLTHPKEAKHIFVSASEWRTAVEAWGWFHQLYIALLRGTILKENEKPA